MTFSNLFILAFSFIYTVQNKGIRKNTTDGIYTLRNKRNDKHSPSPPPFFPFFFSPLSWFMMARGGGGAMGSNMRQPIGQMGETQNSFSFTKPSSPQPHPNLNPILNPNRPDCEQPKCSHLQKMSSICE